MPIANCLIADGAPAAPDNLVARWADHAGTASKHMTINVVRTSAQLGARYGAIAQLYLPSLWSAESIDRIQVGLAHALAEGLELELADVQVLTFVLPSGHVVEHGNVLRWHDD